MKDIFFLNRSQKLVIYGASPNGVYYAKFFINNGFKVEYFIDKKALDFEGSVQVNNDSIPVYTLEQAPIEKRGEYIIYIAIRNALEQTKCAELAGKNGYEKIIFFPLYKKTEDLREGIEALTYVYNEIIAGRIVSNKPCPKQNYLFKKSQYKDVALIKEANEILCYIPTDLIYYHSLEQVNRMSAIYGIPTDAQTDMYYASRPFPQVDFFNEMFSFFLFGRGNIKKYTDIIMKMPNDLKNHSDIEHQEWLNDRKNVIENMLEKACYEKDYWVNSAVTVEWNDDGFFNIQDGIHRYLMASHLFMRKIPAHMKKEDYIKWTNKKYVQACIDSISKIDILPTPISHPYFMECNAETEVVGKTLLSYIQEKVKDIWKTNIEILDTNPEVGYYSQNFARMGGKVTVIIDRNNGYYDSFRKLNKLFYLESKIRCVEKLDETQYDITLCMKWWDYLKNENQWEENIRKINQVTKGIMIWKSGSKPEEEKKRIFDNTNFSQYELLCYVLENKIIREVGIFRK